jgi:hypothetical protein
VCATGDEEAGGKDGAGQGSQHGEVRMARGAWCTNVVEILARVQGHAELADEGLDQQGMGGDEARLGGQRRGALDRLEALGEALGIAHVVVAKEALQAGAAREVDRFEGRPWDEGVAEEAGLFVVDPLPDMREVVLQGPGEAMGEAHVVADEAAAMFDELRPGTHRGTLGGERRQLVAMLEQELEQEFSGGGVVPGVAGREGLALLGQGLRMDGAQDQQRVFT